MFDWAVEDSTAVVVASIRGIIVDRAGLEQLFVCQRPCGRGSGKAWSLCIVPRGSLVYSIASKSRRCLWLAAFRIPGTRYVFLRGATCRVCISYASKIVGNTYVSCTEVSYVSYVRGPPCLCFV